MIGVIFAVYLSVALQPPSPSSTMSYAMCDILVNGTYSSYLITGVSSVQSSTYAQYFFSQRLLSCTSSNSTYFSSATSSLRHLIFNQTGTCSNPTTYEAPWAVTLSGSKTISEPPNTTVPANLESSAAYAIVQTIFTNCFSNTRWKIQTMSSIH